MENKSKTVFHLKSCNTCQRILGELNIDDSWNIREIKSSPINETELEILRSGVSSYEDLLNKRSRTYQQLGLKDKNLTEQELKNWILKEYTFLKRPAFVIGDKVFAGNSKATIQSVKEAL